MATCKNCNHFNACSKWTDFPNQCGVPVCARFEEKSAWISVDERLPEPLERVVVFDSRGNLFTAVYINFATGKNAWCSPLCHGGEVAYWVPLPETPITDKPTHE